MALFCPVKLRRVLNQSNDNTNNTALEEVEWRKCEKDAQIWRDLVGEVEILKVIFKQSFSIRLYKNRKKCYYYNKILS